jgi:drug/metabolite transporter (DMT)-like permease
MLLGALVHVTAAATVGESVANVRPTPLAAATVVYLAVVVGGVGFVAYLTLIDQVGPLRANLTAYVTPLVAILVGWAALAEAVEATTVVGFLVITAGFALLERRELAAELARYRPLVR